MSGVVKAIKKVFKAVVKVVKKIWKPLLIAAAVYFTAGLALSAFPATAGFAASMPGFAAGGLLGGGGAGLGIFTKVAAKLGLGTLGSSGGLIGGALAKGTSMAALASSGIGGSAILAGAAKGVVSGTITGSAATAASTAIGTSGAAALGAGGSAVGGALAAKSAAGALGTVAGKAGMTLTEKLLLAQAGTKVVGAFIAPTEDQVQEAQKKWRGAFYGMEANGTTAPPPAPGAPAPGAPRQLLPPGGAPAQQPPQVQPPPSPQPMGQKLTPQQPMAGTQQQPGARSLLPENGLVDEPFKYGVMQ